MGKEIFWLTENKICYKPLEDALQFEGYNVTAIQAPNKAMPLLKERQVDLILLGLALPVYGDLPNIYYNGIHVLRELKEETSPHKDTPLVIHTVMSQEEFDVTMRIKEKYKGPYLIVSCDVDEFISTVRKALGE